MEETLASEVASQGAALQDDDQPPEESDGLPGGLRLAPVRSADSTWAEDMPLNWIKVYTRDDLLSLRNFLKRGMDLAIMEEKVNNSTQ